MIPTSSLGSASVDPNALRAIEQISHVINDIEQRLQIVRVALAQSVPATGLGQVGATLGQTPTPFGQPFTGFGATNPLFAPGLQNPWALLQSAASNPVVLQQLLAMSQHTGSFYGLPAGVPMGAPFGVPTGFGAPGVIAPFGNPGFLAPTTPFRF